jgi:3D (Asp-Asp-Asp) domain-containing protein
MTGIISTAIGGLFLLSTSGLGATTTAPVVEDSPTFTVSMTGYNAVPEQTDGDPYTTASGAYSNPEVVAARSVDLREKLPFGTVIEIVAHNDPKNPNCGFSAVEEHLGLRVIADSMHPRKRNQIDVLLPAEKSVRAAGRWVNPAVALGVCKNIEIRVVGKVAIKDIPKTQQGLRLAVGVLERADEQALAIKK